MQEEGFVSKDVEDKAVDFYTMIQPVSHKEAFAKGYEKYKNHQEIIERVKK